MEKHTKTPWKKGKGGTIIDTEGKVLALTAGSSSMSAHDLTAKRIADRDFIVQACNSHAALLAACKLAYSILIDSSIPESGKNQIKAAIELAGESG